MTATTRPSGLSAQDRAAVERLIRVKLIGEKPTPIGGCFMQGIAVPGGDQHGMMHLLGLHSPRPTTIALGKYLIDCTSHDIADNPDLAHAWVFLTPMLAGWTLHFGA